MASNEFNDSQWLQIATIIDNGLGIPIESVSENLGVSSYEISQRCSAITKMNSYVRIKTLTGALLIKDVPSNWFTAAEFNLLGFNIMGRGVQVAGRMILPCSPRAEVDDSTGDIVVVLMKKTILYAVPDSVAMRLWELRSEGEAISVSQGGAVVIESLLKKMISIEFEKRCHWMEIDLSTHKKELLSIKEAGLTEEEKRSLRNEVMNIRDGIIQDYSREI